MKTISKVLELFDQGLTVKEISFYTGYPTNSIYYILQRKGVKVKLAYDIIKEMIETGKSEEEIFTQSGYTRYHANNILKRIKGKQAA